MKRISILAFAVMAACAIAAMLFATGRANDEASPIFGIKIPPGYRNWRLVSVAHEEGDNNDLRAILGNDVAIEATGRGSCRSLTAQSLSGWPGVTFRLRKTTKSLAGPNLSLPGPPLTFS